MPFFRRRKKGVRKYYPRRRYMRKRRRRFGGVKFTKFRGPSMMPDMIFTRVKYTGTFSFNSAALASQKLALNGLYDVDLTGAGHQPLGFDQFMAFYGRYEVRGSAIKCTLVNNSSVEYSFALYPSNDSTVGATLTDCQEQPYARAYTMSGNEGQKTITFKSYMGVKKLEGRGIESVNYAGTSASNPTNVKFWYIVTGPIDGSSTTNGYVRYELLFYVRFYQRISLSGS